MAPVSTQEKVIARTSSELVVRAADSVIRRPVWFKTGPLDDDFLYHVYKLQLITESHDQGWVSDPSAGTWTWFELAVFENAKSQSPKVRDGKPLVWKSHSNPQAVGSKRKHVGTVLDRRSGSILNGVEVGNVIGVRACARFGGWANHAYSGRLVATLYERK